MSTSTSNSKRKPPPEQNHFKKGQSGNPAGRPKGAVSTAGITRKFAFKKIPVTVGGKQQQLMRFHVAVLKLRALATAGSAAAAEELSKLRTRLTPRMPDGPTSYLLVPAPMSMEEFIESENERNTDKVQPEAATNLDAEEFAKAVRGEPTIYGRALLAHYKKYRDQHD